MDSRAERTGSAETCTEIRQWLQGGVDTDQTGLSAEVVSLKGDKEPGRLWEPAGQQDTHLPSVSRLKHHGERT